MKKFAFAFSLLLVASSASAALKPGDSLKPYEVQNSRDGAEFCPICAYGAKTVKIAAFGKLNDPAFWADLEQLQASSGKYSKLGVFAQVIDSKDLTAIKAEAAKHGIKFPVVVAMENNWDQIYQVKGTSRTIYYALKANQIAWTTIGLDADASKVLAQKLSVDLAS